MKAVLSYFAVLTAAVGYMLLFDHSAGGMMTVFLIVVPVISIILTLIARKRIEFDVIVPGDVLKKKKKDRIIVTAKKNIFLPVPIVSFEVKTSERIAPLKYNVYRFSMSENRKISVDIDIVPEICGIAEVDVTRMYITDYLGIFRFKINNETINRKIYIIPDIYEIEDSGEVLRSIYSTLPDNDDDDDAQPVWGKASFPGFEYRAYIPGDSPKKINWKLSSKKQQLFVRIDESSGMTRPDIIIDINKSETGQADSYQSALNEETIIEGALSMLMLCVNHGIECTFSYYTEDRREKDIILSVDDVEREALKMSKVIFSPSGKLSDGRESSKSNDVSIVYTSDVSQNIIDSVENAQLNGNSMKVIIPESCMDFNTELNDLWIIDESHAIKRVC